MKKSIEEIFEEFEHHNNPVGAIAQRGPMYSHIEKAEVVFIGINPSYPKGREPKEDPYDLKIAVNEYSKHYKKFSDLAKALNQADNWTYIDVLQLRETKQESVFKLMNYEGGLDFIVEQLRCTMTTLEKIDPKLIVVCNGGARSFFGVDAINDENVWMGYDFENRNKTGNYCMNQNGCFVIKGLQDKSISDVPNTNLVGTKVVFTDNLTYMGKSTQENLIWQLKMQLIKL